MQLDGYRSRTLEERRGRMRKRKLLQLIRVVLFIIGVYIYVRNVTTEGLNI